MCYSEGVPGGATCDLFGQCHCLPGIDIKLAGKRCVSGRSTGATRLYVT